MRNLILTWFHYENFGTALQAYALQKFLNNSNKHTELLNYLPEEKNTTERKNIYDFIKSKKKNFLKRVVKKIYAKALIEKTNLFRKFIATQVPLTNKLYSREYLKELNNKYDNFIVGSDQIWNPKSDLTYWLDFVDNNKNKVAYAPSFGVTSLSEYRKNEIKYLLEKFNYLSVRESEGKKIIKDIINKDVDVVLDPTFLLDKQEWLKLCKNKSNEKYILCYFLGNQNYYWKCVYKIKKETGYYVKIIPIQPEAFFKKGQLKIDIGPIEFIELINNAEIILTDSFHAITFSIIFNKSFIALKRFNDKDKKSQNSRIYNILRIMKLEEHLIDKNTKNLVYKVKDYNRVQDILNEQREKAITYLENAIN